MKRKRMSLGLSGRTSTGAMTRIWSTSRLRSAPATQPGSITTMGDFDCCIIGSDASVAVGRFNPAGVAGYWAKSDPGGVLHPTRAEARAAEHALRTSHSSRLEES